MNAIAAPVVTPRMSHIQDITRERSRAQRRAIIDPTPRVRSTAPATR